MGGVGRPVTSSGPRARPLPTAPGTFRSSAKTGWGKEDEHLNPQVMAKVFSKVCFLLQCQPRCQGCIPIPVHTEDTGCGWDILRVSSRTGQRAKPEKSLVPYVNQGQSPAVLYRGTGQIQCFKQGRSPQGSAVSPHGCLSILCLWFQFNPS